MKLTEAQIQLQIIEALRFDGWLCVRNAQGAFAHKGYADWTIIKKGRVIFMEIKTATGRQSQSQLEFMHVVRCAGGEYMLVRRLEDVAELLEKVSLT